LEQQVFFDDSEPTTYELMREERTQQIMDAGFFTSKGE
jgi:hypothetical protein